MTTSTGAAVDDPLIWFVEGSTCLSADADLAAASHPGKGLLVQVNGGGVVAANAMACDLLGLDRDQLLDGAARHPRWSAVTAQGLPITGDHQPSMRTLATGTPVRGFLMGVTIPGGSVHGAFDDRTRWLDVTTHPLYRRSVGSAASQTGVERAVAPPAGVLVAYTDVSHTPPGRAATESLLSSYRTLGEMASDVILRTDANGIVAWISESVQRVLGIDPGQVLGQPMALWLHPQDAEPVETISEQFGGHAESWEFECRWRTGSRSFRWMSAQARPIRDRRGDIVGAVIGLRDINEQVLAREALASSERRYRMLAENATDAVYLVNPSGVVMWTSPAVRRIFGLEPTALVGTPFAERVHDESRLPLRSAQSQAAKGQSGVHVELRMRTAAGDYRWVSSVCGPARDDDGRVVGRIVALRDIHDEVLARAALIRSERTFRLALDGAPAGMAVIGLDGRFLLVNDALCRLVDRDRTWLSRHTESDLLHPERRQSDLEIRDRLLAQGAPAVYNIHDGRLVTADGRVVWVVHSMGLVRDEDGRPQFFVSHYQDVTQAHDACEQATA